MQWILGLDFSTRPCEITVSRVDGTSVEVYQRKTVDLELLSEPSLLAREDTASLIVRRSQKADSAPHKEATGGEPSPNQQENASESQTSSSESSLAERIAETLERLRETLRTLEPVWTSSVVTLPAHNTLSLNVNLPFGDTKNLNRIVDLEVQDLVPFELDEFVVQYSSLGPVGPPVASSAQGVASPAAAGRGLFDVHVALLPRALVRSSLAICRAVGLEPFIMTIPSSAVAAVFHLAKDYFRTNAAIVFAREAEYSLAVFVNGQVRVEHTIHRLNVTPLVETTSPESFLEEQQRALFTTLKLMIAAVERRYDARIETLYVLGKAPKTGLLQQIIGRTVEPLQLSDVMKSPDPALGISALPAIFAADENPAPILTNFRTRDFSYSPKFGDLLLVITSTWRHLAVASIAVFLAIAGYYAIGEYQIRSLRSFLTDQIRLVIPEFVPPEGDLRGALVQAETKLIDDLGVLSSPAKVTPLDALIEITQRIPADPGITIQTVKISGTRATITGTAPDLSAIERVQKELKNNKGAFSKVTAIPGNPNGSRYGFNVEVVLSQ